MPKPAVMPIAFPAGEPGRIRHNRKAIVAAAVPPVQHSIPDLQPDLAFLHVFSTPSPHRALQFITNKAS